MHKYYLNLYYIQISWTNNIYLYQFQATTILLFDIIKSIYYYYNLLSLAFINNV